RPAAPRGPRLDLRSPAHRVERELLKLALQRPDLVAPVFDAYGADEFTAAPYATVREAIAEAGGTTGADDGFLTRAREAAPDDTVRSLITELAVEPLLTRKEPDEFYAGTQLAAVRLAAVDRRIGQIQGSMRRCEAGGDMSAYASLQEELWVLEQYRQDLRNRGAAAL
ncbi:DNA primase, partial [Streptomyces sp. SID5475]|nr:DNA primase [Streptomyces sp. SID5475]